MEELDAVAPNNPVYISRCCGHVGVGNSLAFAAAGVTENTADPNGGHIEKRDGRLTGQMQENAQRLIFTAIPALTLEETVTAIENAANQLLKFGVASVMDAGVGFDGLMDMAAFQTARRSGRLPLRAYLAILAGPDGILDECHRLGLVTGAGDEFLKIGPAKLFADGSIGGLTAAMSQPYLNDGVNRGLFIYSDQDMNEMVADYMTRGYQVATHAIGDAAIEQVLSAYEKGISAGGSARLRHRIEHCEFTTFDQIRRMKSAGILPIPQPCFLTHFSDAYAQAVGAEATAASSPLRTWIENGMSPATSTDSPICPPRHIGELGSHADAERA
ncbi:amidohydrolase [Ensifer adhaerens]